MYRDTDMKSPVEVAEMISNREPPDATVKTGGLSIPDPIVKFEKLPNDRAKEAYKNFGYYRIRYFGRRHILWQIEMAQILMAWMELGRKAYEAGDEVSAGDTIKGIVNTPPGGGKTTTITHDFPAWLICRNRDIRIALGARTSPQSERYVRRLRSTLERNVLLNAEFGRFKPEDPELWRRNEFVVDGVTGHAASLPYKLSLAGFDPEDPRVMEHVRDPEDPIHEILESLDAVFMIGEKEPTVTALSQELGFLGGRYDLNIWDDLCDKNNSRTPDQREGLVEWWFAEAESRCEPGGLVALVGTRFGRYDLYNHCKGLTYQTEDDIDETLGNVASGSMTAEQIATIREDLERELVESGKPYGELTTAGKTELRKSRPIYFYHRFPAHDDKRCPDPSSLRNKDHINCVLDPQRFNYLYLLKQKAANARKYELTYQQLDETTEENLVQMVWLTGGQDSDGFICPGCYDYSRRLLQIPQYLKPENCVSVGTVDPSAQNWWSIQWWLWDAETDTDYLINLMRARLSAGAFLDYDMTKRAFSGIQDQWQLKSIEMGWPIKLWIMEQSAAQRYLFQHRWVQEWMKVRGTAILGHETNRNKADPEYGVETIGPRYKRGNVSLPFDQSDPRTRVVIGEFVKELTEWPDGLTEDMVMGQWFHHFRRPTYTTSLRAAKANRVSEHPVGPVPEYVREDHPFVIYTDEGKQMSHRERRALNRDRQE
jgi:hypothetical protein